MTVLGRSVTDTELAGFHGAKDSAGDCVVTFTVMPDGTIIPDVSDACGDQVTVTQKAK